jgi:AcrR family transcriptional regulator
MGRPKEVTDEQIVAAARRCLLDRGAGVPAAEIARELGVSHTTLFNRFGSKEALMIAALGPPERLPWAARLDAGPDERPVPEQLIEIGREMSTYFRDLGAGFAVLRAAGITPDRVFEGRKEPTPVQAYKALSGWLGRAQKAGRIETIDIEFLTAAVLSVMHSWASTSEMCGRRPARGTDQRFVEQFFETLWNGIAPRDRGRPKQ